MRYALVLLLALPLAACSGGTGSSAEASQTHANTSWTSAATQYRGQDGATVEYVCPAAPTRIGTVWGTDLYSDDSSVCGAGVHAGIITQETGGRVVIEMQPGAESYTGSARNGVETRDYGSWSGSYRLLP